MRRRNVSAEEKGERIQVSLKLPKEILDRIDESWMSGGIYTGRSHYIEEACKYYLDCVPCPKCGVLNKSSARICSSCETKLEPYQDILRMIESLVREYDDACNEMISCTDEFNDLSGKINWHLKKLEPKKREIISEIVSPYVHLISNYIESVNNYLKYYDIFSKDSSSVPQDFFSEKFPDFDAQKILQTYFETGVADISMSLLDEIHDDMEYSLMNFYHHSAKRILSNPDQPNKHFHTYSQLSSLRNLLWDKKPKLIRLKDTMNNCLAYLNNIENTIDLINENINS